MHTGDARWLTALAFVLVAVTWIVFATEEPFHIDELRQLGGYWGGPGQWLSTSWALNQPPLEVALGGTWRLAFGATDFAERLLPTLFGLGSVGILGYLSKQFAGNRFAPAITILAYGFSPIVLRTTAFIRPYAIPTFFALLFVVAVRSLLRTGPNAKTLTFSGLSGLLLVLTQALVPVMVSLFAVAGLLVRRYVVRENDPGGTSALAVAGITFVASLAMPIITRIKNPTFFETQTPYGLRERFVDSVSAFVSEFDAAFGLAGLALAALVILLLFKPFRPTRGEVWWFIPLAAISPGISAVFFASVAPGFSFFDRYFHDLMLPGALAIGLVGSRLLLAPRESWRIPSTIIGAVALALYAIPTAIGFHAEVTEQETTDWEQASHLIMENVEPDTVVLFEFLREFPRYQPLFYGQPRYLPTWYQIRLPRAMVTSSHRLGEEPIVVLLAGDTRTSVAPPGWRIVDDGEWRLLIPPNAVARDGAEVLTQLDAAITDERYDVAIRFGLALELARTGHFEAAEAVLAEISPPPGSDPQRRFEQYLESTRLQIANMKAGA